MPLEERNTLISLITNLALNGYVVWHLTGLYGSGALDGADAPQILARFLVWVIAVGVALGIGMAIASSIGAAIAARRDPGANIVDERDRLFEARGLAATLFFAAIGFIGSFIALAMGTSPVTAFVLIYFSFAVASLVGDIVRLVSYRADC